MKTIQIYNLHLAGGDVIPAAEAYDLKGKKTIVSLFENAENEDIFCISDTLLGSCYVPRKHILYITTGEVRKDAEHDRFETNVAVIERRKCYGSQN